MSLQILQDPSSKTFSTKLLDIGDMKDTTNEAGCIKYNTQIMSGSQKEQFQQQKMSTLTN